MEFRRRIDGESTKMCPLGIEDYNVMIDGTNFFDQPVNHKERKYYNIQNIVNGRKKYISTSCLLDYRNFKDHLKMIIIIDLSKKHAIDADPKVIQNFNFTENLKANVKIDSILEDVKETVLVLKGNYESIVNLICFYITSR